MNFGWKTFILYILQISLIIGLDQLFITKYAYAKAKPRSKISCRQISRCSRDSLVSMLDVFDKAIKFRNSDSKQFKNWREGKASFYGVKGVDRFAGGKTSSGVCMDPNFYTAAVSLARHDPSLNDIDNNKNNHEDAVLGSIYLVRYHDNMRMLVTTDLGKMIGNQGLRDFDFSTPVASGIAYETDDALKYKILAPGQARKDGLKTSEVVKKVSCVSVINKFVFEKNKSSQIPKELVALMKEREQSIINAQNNSKDRELTLAVADEDYMSILQSQNNRKPTGSR